MLKWTIKMRYSLNQLQAFVEISRHGFHVSKAAEHLNTSQSVLSKQLKSFEKAFAGQVFVRTGKRLIGLTPEGAKILSHAERVLQDVASIERIAAEANSAKSETLQLATTPTLAHYLLTQTVKKFKLAFADVHLGIQVEESDKAVEAVRLGNCDFAIAPVGGPLANDLSVEILLEWTRVLIGTADCPLFTEAEITLEKIATQPIIAFETPTVSLRKTFEAHGLTPNYALHTSNPDVMKAYAANGMGVAVVATPTFDAARDKPLLARDVSHLFPNVKIAAIHRTGDYRTVMQTRFLEYLKSEL